MWSPVSPGPARVPVDRTPSHAANVVKSGDLAPFGDYLKSALDHRLINDQVDFHPTTAYVRDLTRLYRAWIGGRVGQLDELTLARITSAVQAALDL